MSTGSGPSQKPSHGAQELLNHAYGVAILPLGLGAHQVVTALEHQHWADALLAALTTGGAVAVLVLSIAALQRVVGLLASRGGK